MNISAGDSVVFSSTLFFWKNPTVGFFLPEKLAVGPGRGDAQEV